MRFQSNGHRLSIIGGRIIRTCEVNVSDSFVKYNKLETSGSGEARLYLGTRDRSRLFWGEEFINGRETYIGIIHKTDLLYYLDTAEIEYIEPQNFYRNQSSLESKYLEYRHVVENLDEENIFFVKLHNGTDDYRQNRVYCDGVIDVTIDGFPTSNRAPIYDLLRSILLPIISRIQITKIIDTESENQDAYMWFRPYIHETSRLNPPALVRDEELRIKEDTSLSSTMRYNLLSARIGQGKFRGDILDRYQSICAISESDQVHILEACHIKPWINSSDMERLDKCNGILLTRNLHKLFDLGFFTFDTNYDVVFSSFITRSAKREFRSISTYVKGILRYSERYLQYHRDNVYREYI